MRAHVPAHPLLAAWRRLSQQERQRAIAELADLHATGSWTPGLDAQLATVTNFRPVAIRRAPPERIGRLLGQAMHLLAPAAFNDLLVSLHVSGRQTLLGEVYDALGVAHQGVEVDEAILAGEVSVEQARSGLEALVERLPVEPLWLCLAVLEEVCSAGWRPAVSAGRALVESGLPVAASG